MSDSPGIGSRSSTNTADTAGNIAKPSPQRPSNSTWASDLNANLQKDQQRSASPIRMNRNNNNNKNNNSSPISTPVGSHSSSRLANKRASIDALKAASNQLSRSITSSSPIANGMASINAAGAGPTTDSASILSSSLSSTATSFRRKSNATIAAGGTSNLSSSLSRSIPKNMQPIAEFQKRPLSSNSNNGSYLGRSMSPGRSLINGAVMGSSMNRPESPIDSLSEAEVARIVSEHLVSPTDSQDLGGEASQDAISAVNPQDIGSVSHTLLGGAVTREIYQWKEKRLNNTHQHRRRNSEPDLTVNRRSPELIRASDLREPGMFRRHFVTRKAEQEGRAPNIFTRNFIDFLALYGFYGGDVYPEDEDDEDESSVAESGRDEEAPDESTPL
ncbi:neutral amino acid transporter, partial [Chytridiales sp. JEL 0842]